MSENAAFIKMLREGEWHEGDINYDDLLRAASLIERLEAENKRIREAAQTVVDSQMNARMTQSTHWKDVTVDALSALLKERKE